MKQLRDCYPKIRKRAKTLLLPYVVWNVIFVLWYFVLQNLPLVSSMINNDVVGSITSNGALNGLYVLFIKPIAFQLWFLRDLIIYVVLSPVILWFLKRIKWGLPVLLFIASWVGLILLPSEIKIWGAFFFVLGGYMGVFHSLEDISRWLKKPIIVAAFLLYLSNAVCIPFVASILPGSAIFFMLCGVLSIWGGYDVLFTKVDSRIASIMAKLGKYSFFVYCFHEPVLNIIKKVGLGVIGASNANLIVLYLINPIVMYALTFGIAKVLQNNIPKLYSVLTGGR